MVLLHVGRNCRKSAKHALKMSWTHDHVLFIEILCSLDPANRPLLFVVDVKVCADTNHRDRMGHLGLYRQIFNGVKLNQASTGMTVAGDHLSRIVTCLQ
jgi:hypothetical protein